MWDLNLQPRDQDSNAPLTEPARHPAFLSFKQWLCCFITHYWNLCRNLTIFGQLLAPRSVVVLVVGVGWSRLEGMLCKHPSILSLSISVCQASSTVLFLGGQMVAV